MKSLNIVESEGMLVTCVFFSFFNNVFYFINENLSLWRPFRLSSAKVLYFIQLRISPRPVFQAGKSNGWKTRLLGDYCNLCIMCVLVKLDLVVQGHVLIGNFTLTMTMDGHCPKLATKKLGLTLSQTTNLRLDETESLCRRQIKCC